MEKDNHFSFWWVLGGIAIMFVTSLLGGYLAGEMGIRDGYATAGVALVCFAIGGFVIGMKSAGSTILEAGIAAVATLALSFVVQGQSLPAKVVALLVGFGLPFLAALFGAWLGEKVQGD
jgi:hypothetical protein